MPNEQRPVQVKRAAEVHETNTGQTEGIVRQGAIVKMSDQICGTLARCQPHSASAVHHHGEQDIVVYAVSGRGSIVSEGGNKRQNLSPGDWALIPAYAEHTEVNDGDEEAVWVIVRAPGGVPVVENLSEWGESLKSPQSREGDESSEAKAEKLKKELGGNPGFKEGEMGEAPLAS